MLFLAISAVVTGVMAGDEWLEVAGRTIADVESPRRRRIWTFPSPRMGQQELAMSIIWERQVGMAEAEEFSLGARMEKISSLAPVLRHSSFVLTERISIRERSSVKICSPV